MASGRGRRAFPAQPDGDAYSRRAGGPSRCRHHRYRWRGRRRRLDRPGRHARRRRHLQRAACRRHGTTAEGESRVTDRDRQFQELRPLLFSLAYRTLGTRADADDIVQDAWLRWRSASDDEIRSPKAWLTTVVARLALDALKSAYRKRETYVGP